MNLTSMAAKCRQCDAVFGLHNLPQPLARPPRRKPSMPKGVSIVAGEPPIPDEGDYRRAPSHELGELIVKRRWFHWSVLFMSVFVIFWDGFLIYWYFGALSSVFSPGFGGGPGLTFILFPLIHVAVGVGMTYWTLATWLNTTTIKVDGENLSVRHAPIPWPGNQVVPTRSVRQLFVRKKVRRGKNGTTVTWELHAETDELASLKLMAGARDKAQIEYIEWAVEQHLGIVDDPSLNEGY